MGNQISDKAKKPQATQKNLTKPNTGLKSGKRGETSCLNGITINGEYIYTAENDKKGIARIAVYSFSGEFITSFSNSHMVQPWSIGSHRNNVYVTDIEKHTLYHYGDADGVSVSNMVGGKGSGETEFNCPTQLSVSSNGQVYVADRYNDRVQVLDWSLKYLRRIAHPSLTQPVDVKTVRNTLYVLSYSNSDSYNVHTFYANGEKSTCNLNSPQFMAENISIQFGPMSSIVMKDADTDQIKVFERKGELLQEIQVVYTEGQISSSNAVVSRGKANNGFRSLSLNNI